ncbi:MAG: hypothetical protein JEZ09_02340 [Salinivirgaceae bacterium]|nr:hypothetical protein [Salinivirgaceae bacterium]
MKNIVFLLSIVTIGCSTPKFNPENVVKNYVRALNTGNFNLISANISDSLLYWEMEYLVSDSKDKFYENFKWDSVFLPQVELIEFISLGKDSASVILSKNCQRIQFLQGKNLVCKQNYYFENNILTKIKNTKFIDEDFAIWAANLDSLNIFIDANHSDLSGFANDISLKGAQNYLKAIDLYKNR